LRRRAIIERNMRQGMNDGLGHLNDRDRSNTASVNWDF
jgi:hypothetical protein